ncbi:MAG TPA: HAMP domain-containing sensor histidine kinase, partial [Phycisphaerales bacterium]|nr:HAMP domain-containing sensor histidine kinase [Phycisphaerales bacterium]
MTRPGPNLIVYWACSAAVIAALVWMTTRAIRLERRDAHSQAFSSRQEAIRLALWRMDSAMTPVIARETARPFFHYRSFYPTDRAFTRMLDQAAPGEVLVPSPLLDAPIGVIRLYFQVNLAGEMTSPQAPSEEARRATGASGPAPTNIVAAQDQLARFELLWRADRNPPLDHAGQASASHDETMRAGSTVDDSRTAMSQESPDELTREFDRRQERLSLAISPGPATEIAAAQTARDRERPRASATREAAAETSPRDAAQFTAESRATETNDTVRLGRDLTLAAKPPLAKDQEAEGDGGEEPSGVAVSADHVSIVTTELAPSWIGPDSSPQLVFTRRVTVGGEEFQQGFWLDWELTRSWLLSGIGDLLPWADLRPVREPVRSRSPEALGRTLASIPAEVVIGQPIVTPVIGWTPLRTGLVVAWVAVLASLAVTWRVLLALEELAERRGRFAAAVSHELRTPLTTFSLYTQMLADGMVPPARQREYIETMRSESGRLAGIVQSVLEYARLGRSAGASPATRIELRRLLEPIVASLADRARTRGFEFKADMSGNGQAVVMADAAGVERILGNLIDNACAYAREHEPRFINLGVSIGRRYAAITVTDHGPGLTPEESSRAFEPYFRGSRTTALGIPGIGLGLALARGVARQMGGD